MNLMNETEREQLSAYLDRRLTADETAALERRLASDPALRFELDTLRETQMLVRGLPILRAPRSFALTPAMVRLRSRPLYLSTWVSFASAAAAMVLMALGLFTSMTANAPSPLENQAPPAVAVMPTDSATLSVQATAAMPTGTQASLLSQTRVDEAQADQDPSANAEQASQATPAAEARTVEGTQTLEAAVMAAPAAADSAAGAAASGIAEASPPLTTDALQASGETEAAAEMQFAATMPAQPTLSPTRTAPASPTLTTTLRPSATPQPTAQVAQLPTDTDDSLPQDGTLAQRQAADINPSLLLIGAGIVLLLVALVTTVLRMRRG